PRAALTSSSSQSAVSWISWAAELHETGPHSPSFSENGQVLVELPLGELHAVVVPFAPLQLDVAVEDVGAQRLPGEFGACQLVDRLAGGLGQRDDSSLPTLLRGEVVQVRLHRVGQVVAVLDPLEARMQERRKGQVRIAGWIGAPNLGARRLLRSRLVERDPDQRRPVS